jgi:hypothetical protein
MGTAFSPGRRAEPFYNPTPAPGNVTGRISDCSPHRYGPWLSRPALLRAPRTSVQFNVVVDGEALRALIIDAESVLMPLPLTAPIGCDRISRPRATYRIVMSLSLHI